MGFYFFDTSILGRNVISNIPADNTTHAYSAHCFSGHSPIWQVPKTKKVLNDQANISAPKAIFKRLAHI